MRSAPFTALGTFAHTPKRGHLEIIEHGLVHVDASGIISDVIRPDQPRYQAVREQAATSGQLIEGGPGSLFLPGMVDLHIHAPQWPQLGQALHLPLDQWLREYTSRGYGRVAIESGFLRVYTASLPSQKEYHTAVTKNTAHRLKFHEEGHGFNSVQMLVRNTVF